MPVSLKSILKGVPDGVDLTLVTICPLESFDKKDKKGKYEAHEVKLRTEANGEIYTEKMFPNLIEQLHEGDTIRATLGDNGYPQYRKVMIGEARNNITEVKKERKLKSLRDEETIGRILHGFIQGALSSGKSPEEAGRIALQCYEIHEQSIKYIIERNSKDIS